MIPLREQGILQKAEFDSKVQTYWLLSGAWILAATVVGILLLPVWFAIGRAVTGHYLRHMKCVLTDRTLQVTKGVLTRVEKTVPLDQITDLGLVQGPVMRLFGLEAMSVETAGQSAQGALVKLVGIVDTRRFRDAVLTQRDILVAALADESQPPSEVVGRDRAASGDVLCDIRDILRRIEEKLGSRADA